MITRPLDLASRLRPQPANFDALFLVNAGLIALFFVLFGSRFVLAPGLAETFQIPVFPGSTEGARMATHTIKLTQTGSVISDRGMMSLQGLGDWLKEAAKTEKHPVLLILEDQRVSAEKLLEVEAVAIGAGFEIQVAANNPPAAKVSR